MRERAAVLLLCAAQFVDVLGVTIAVIGLPEIGRRFPGAEASEQWVVSGYALLFGGFLVSAGRVADRYGHRRTFVWGMAAFLAASLAGGLAPGIEVLITARALQGLAAAFVVPAAFAMVLSLTEGRERVVAVGWWTATAAAGGAAGFLFGGLLVHYVGWRSIFLLNVPICSAVLLLARSLLPARTGHTGRGSLDLPGAMLVTGGLLAGIYGVSAATGPVRVVALVVAVALLAVFVVVERRTVDPLVPARLVGTLRFSAALTVAFALTFATTPASVLGTVFFQQQQGLSAGTTGFLFAPFSLGVVGGSWLGTRLLDRLSGRWVAFGAFGVVAVALVIGLIAVRTGSTAGFAVSLAISGSGLGAASVAATNAGTAMVGETDRGIASGLLNTAPQLGSALGTAVIGTVALGGGGPDLPAGILVALGTAVMGTGATLGLSGPRVTARRPRT
ncbi:hypothetical protein DMC63_06105 [Streptomyces sp. WAC 05977]|nr:hypothetical protein DMC63_06105 [Streptomyces sp. WAC 05977]